MPDKITDLAIEVKRLRRCMNDVVSVLALPAVWSGREPNQIVETLLDALLEMLDLDFLYGQVRIDADNTRAEVLRIASHSAGSYSREEIHQALSPHFEKDPQWWIGTVALYLGQRDVSIFPMQIGVEGELGIIVTGSRRIGFPEESERLVIRVAANQTAIGLQQALLMGEQMRVATELDRRVTERTAELAAANQVLRKEIFERKEVELRLLESKDRLKQSEFMLSQVIDAIPTLAWSMRPDGPNEFLSQRWHDYTGLSREESHGWGWQVTFHPEDLPTLMEVWQELLTSGQPGEMEARIRRHDGVYRWFLIRCSPFLDETGRILRWYGTSTDIHDWKVAEEDLRNTQAELARMMRAMTIGQLTASIAHEVSQPLFGIITNASTCLRMLNSDPPNIDGARETTQRTIRDGNRATDVIARLRTLFIKKQINIESVDLNEAAREVITLLSAELQKEEVLLNTQLNEKLPRVMGDRVQLQQVILNLIRNASEAMSMVTGRPRRLLIQTEVNGDLVRVSVQDSGSGFDTEIASQIFESFFTTKKEGMGIGLSVSRSIIEAHHGRLWATRNDGPGSTFAFTIPRDSNPEP
jgi:PAS domain S-box-containing protein